MKSLCALEECSRREDYLKNMWLGWVYIATIQFLCTTCNILVAVSTVVDWLTCTVLCSLLQMARQFMAQHRPGLQAANTFDMQHLLGSIQPDASLTGDVQRVHSAAPVDMASRWHEAHSAGEKTFDAAAAADAAVTAPGEKNTTACFTSAIRSPQLALACCTLIQSLLPFPQYSGPLLLLPPWLCWWGEGVGCIDGERGLTVLMGRGRGLTLLMGRGGWLYWWGEGVGCIDGEMGLTVLMGRWGWLYWWGEGVDYIDGEGGWLCWWGEGVDCIDGERGLTVLMGRGVDYRIG